MHYLFIKCFYFFYAKENVCSFQSTEGRAISFIEGGGGWRFFMTTCFTWILFLLVCETFLCFLTLRKTHFHCKNLARFSFCMFCPSHPQPFSPQKRIGPFNGPILFCRIWGIQIVVPSQLKLLSHMSTPKVISLQKSFETSDVWLLHKWTKICWNFIHRQFPIDKSLDSFQQRAKLSTYLKCLP